MADVHIDKLLTNPDFMSLMDLAAQAVSDVCVSCADSHNVPLPLTHPCNCTCSQEQAHFFLLVHSHTPSLFPLPPPPFHSSILPHPLLSSFLLFQAAKKSSPSPQLPVVPMHESPRRSTPLFKASLNLSAPVIILPLALGGGMVLDLGDVSLNAAPEYREESTAAALVANVQLSAAQLYRYVWRTARLMHCSSHTHTHPYPHTHTRMLTCCDPFLLYVPLLPHFHPFSCAV